MYSGGKHMISTSKDINPLIKELRSNAMKESEFSNTIARCVKLHEIAYDDYFMIPCNHNEHTIMPTAKDATIAWNLWHISRIEDMVVSRLICHKEELFEQWFLKLNTSYKDTGNAMTDEEILELSRQIDYMQLIKYREAVGNQTLAMLSDLAFSDLGRKVRKEDIDILSEKGSVSTHPDAIWLLDFWGKKDVLGLLMMPVLRHPFVHLFDNLKLYEKIKKMPKHLIDIE